MDIDGLSNEQVEQIAAALARVFIAKAKRILSGQGNEHIDAKKI
jgi:hypothetical protein